MKYAAYLWNKTPNKYSGLSPEEIFYRTKAEKSDLVHMKVFGCPTFVLEPQLQDKKKIPKWLPRSRMGQFLGFSHDHASTVPLIRNLSTGKVSFQFHVVFDELFTTIYNGDMLTAPHPQWTTLFTSSRINFTEGLDYLPDLTPEWGGPPLAGPVVPPVERENARYNNRDNEAPAEPPPPDPGEPPTQDPAGQLPPAEPPPPATPARTPTAPRTPATPTRAPARVRFADPQTPTNPVDPVTPRTPGAPRTPTTPMVSGPSPTPRRNPYRGVRDNTEYRGSTNTSTFGYPAAELRNDVFLSCLPPTTQKDFQHELFQALHSNLYDVDSGIQTGMHPLAFAAKLNSADFPSYHEAMNNLDEKEEWIKAMQAELAQLHKMDCWDVIDRTADMNVLTSVWAFRKKRFPDGRVRKYKARFCVRGFEQKDGIDYFEEQIYSPVVGWGTIRTLLTLAVHLNLETTQVDYTNAFIHAPLSENVYCEMPKGFRIEGKILKLKRSLYGLRQSPVNFFKRLKSALEKTGLKQQNEHNPCLFIGKGVICITYVDDCLFFAKDQASIDKVIASIQDKKRDDRLELNVEDDVAGFLGILMKKHEDGSVELLQTGLIDRILRVMKLDNCGSKPTPSDTKPLGTDKNGPSCEESWSYASVLGMMMYLASNSRPDITYAVHAAARHTHNPRASHEVALKRIARYLQGTRDRDMIIKPNTKLQLDCAVDADFAGLFSVEDPEDPVCAKSRTGYVITLGGTPILWVSKLQSQFALSTTESEYIALSTAMRDVLPLRRLLDCLAPHLDPQRERLTKLTIVWEDNDACRLLANSGDIPRITPRNKHFATQLHWFKSHLGKDIIVERVDTANQGGDIMTKGLAEKEYVPKRKMLMGWISLHRLPKRLSPRSGNCLWVGEKLKKKIYILIKPNY